MNKFEVINLSSDDADYGFFVEFDADEPPKHLKKRNLRYPSVIPNNIVNNASQAQVGINPHKDTAKKNTRKSVSDLETREPLDESGKLSFDNKNNHDAEIDSPDGDDYDDARKSVSNLDTKDTYKPGAKIELSLKILEKLCERKSCLINTFTTMAKERGVFADKRFTSSAGQTRAELIAKLTKQADLA